MKVHPDEFAMAREYSSTHDFEHLNPEQIHQVMVRGRELHKWFRAHTRLHAAIGLSTIGSIFTVDWLVWIALARWFVAAVPGTWALILAAIFTGAVHSWLVYSLSIYSLHEGAAHNLIFPGTSPLSRAASFLSTNMCRLSAAEPEYYSECHMAHHAKFGTEDDSEFLNFIFPRRLWLNFLPLGSFFNYTDFFVHRTPAYTRSSATSGFIAAIYNGLYLFMLYRFFGLLFTVIVILLMPHIGFYVDRMRQFTEHNLMPLENNSGARSLGVGFWGLLVGGGPWGQPCHLAHHMVASIPWYQQIILHRHIVGLLTVTQRKQFLLKPIVGFPALLWAILRESNHFSRASAARSSPAIDHWHARSTMHQIGTRRRTVLGNRSWDGWIRQYSNSHQNPVNRACHTVGIPMIALSVLVIPLIFWHTRFWMLAVSLFAVGWIFQFIGHAFEGKPPEFFQDWRFLFVGLRWWFATMAGKA